MFYNDLDSEVAGRADPRGGRLEGRRPVEKYDAATDEGVAVVGGGDDGAEGSGDSGLTGAAGDGVRAGPRPERTRGPSLRRLRQRGPIISRVRVRPDPAVLGVPVTFTPEVRGAAGADGAGR